MLISKMPDGSPEVYKAFQGEGTTMGELCVFVRTAGCSLRCTFCDTSYTWLFDGDKLKHKYSEPVNREKHVGRVTPEELGLEIRKAAGPIRRVIFTGGEPLLQQDEILKVIDFLEEDGEFWVIEIETNGTIKFNEDLIPFVEYINCSPKMENSGNPKSQRNKPEVIEQFFDLAKDVQGPEMVIFKFVVGIDTFKGDLKEIRAWQKEHDIPNNMVYLMPEGIEPEQIIEGTKYLFENACSKYGYQLSTRLQVLLYGSQRAT